jgi:hypothetical protein
MCGCRIIGRRNSDLLGILNIFDESVLALHGIESFLGFRGRSGKGLKFRRCLDGVESFLEGCLDRVEISLVDRYLYWS